MTEKEAVEQISCFVSKTISWINIHENGEYVVLEGLAYLWQKNHHWSDEFTADVVAMLLGNFAFDIDEHHNHELIELPF
jgi:hypothetical protein